MSATTSTEAILRSQYSSGATPLWRRCRTWVPRSTALLWRRRSRGAAGPEALPIRATLFRMRCRSARDAARDALPLRTRRRLGCAAAPEVLPVPHVMLFWMRCRSARDAVRDAMRFRRRCHSGCAAASAAMPPGARHRSSGATGACLAEQCRYSLRSSGLLPCARSLEAPPRRFVASRCDVHRAALRCRPGGHAAGWP